MIGRLAITVACVLGGVAFLGGVADAHANYVRSNPASDARLVKPPAEVRIEFSEPPDPKGSDIQVLDTSGKRHDKGDIAPSGDPNGLKVSVGPIGEGGYLVAWTATSAVDGHTTKGNFAFVVGSGPLPAVPDVGASAPPPEPLEIAGRALSYAGIALGLGTAFFVLFLRVPAESEETRRESMLLLAAGALIFVGSVALIAEQGSKLPPRLGALLAIRAFTGIVLAALSVAPPLARMRPVAALANGAAVMTLGALSIDRPRRVIALVAGLAAALTATLVSHATALGSLKSMVLDFTHVVAISVWTGGVVALLVIILLRARENTPEQRRALGATVWRFSVTALVAVALLVTAGTLQAFDRLVLIDDLYETPYGIALAVKIAMLVTALAIGALNLLRWGPRLRAGLAARAALVRDTIAESAIFVVIILAAAFLTAFAPPAQPSAAAYDQTQHVSGLRLEMLVASAQPGRNRYVLRVHQGLAPVQSAEKVAFRFTMIEHDMGTSSRAGRVRRRWQPDSDVRHLAHQSDRPAHRARGRDHRLHAPGRGGRHRDIGRDHRGAVHADRLHRPVPGSGRRPTRDLRRRHRPGREPGDREGHPRDLQWPVGAGASRCGRGRGDARTGPLQDRHRGARRRRLEGHDRHRERGLRDI